MGGPVKGLLTAVPDRGASVLSLTTVTGSRIKQLRRDVKWSKRQADHSQLSTSTRPYEKLSCSPSSCGERGHKNNITFTMYVLNISCPKMYIKAKDVCKLANSTTGKCVVQIIIRI
jgi:hypothetical protein